MELWALLRPTVDGHRYSPEEIGRRAPNRNEPATRCSIGVEFDPGGDVTLGFTVRASAQGAWEIAWDFSGHVERGRMEAPVTE